ncbi:acetate--CoA ligase family protein [Ramlibacter sp. Leaf400]|uniref:acetate--CoA ligase family protein n=1 Tax=Ramlibacter sp. Leaf400 TaxID=1736365 RepID=UPI0006FA2349|nr:acetate--CoA ligase family protein [Ramlibacter sp. Leaf400]KQT13905.1 pimeloyl-CoA synthetase [Ramlibacter sp. Leaf400]
MSAARDWVHAAFEPASVAVIGASDNPEKIGGRPIKYMLRHGFRGRILPVNPQRSEVQGLPCWPDVDALPEVPELVVIAVPGEGAVEAVAACARRGVKLGVVISSGFAETGEAGRDAQQRLLAAARAGGMRLVGPNTQGTVNFATGAIASFATLIGEVPPAPGAVAIVSQSGAMSVVPYAFLRAEGLGVRHAHATGNECDLTVADFAEAVAGDPEVRLVLLYLESVPDPAALARAARRAAERGVPVLALKAGVSTRGQAAASSHTGAIATEDKVLDAFLRQNGILRVPDMRSLVRSARMWIDGVRPTGRRVAAISNSGACCVMAADAAERHGLDMQPFPPGVQQALAAVLPAFASGANPVDLTAALLGNSGLFGQVLPLLAQADVADSYFISLPMSGKGYDVPRFAQDARAFARATGRPVAVASPLASTRQAFEDAGVPCFAHDEDAMAALGELARGEAIRAEARRLAALDAGPAATPPLPSGSGFLSEADSLAQVRGLGIAVVPHRLCATRDALRDALREIPGPWALKICSAAIPHKTEFGLVRLGVASEAAALDAFDTLVDRCAALGKPCDGVLVASMLRGRRELVLGARWDDRFGAVVMAGDGGTYVEAMPDVATVVWPFDAAHLRERLDTLRIAPLWRGVRGEPGLPANALARAGEALGRWVHAQRGRVSSVDLNPLVAAPDGTLVALDALVELAPR